MSAVLVKDVTPGPGREKTNDGLLRYQRLQNSNIAGTGSKVSAFYYCDFMEGSKKGERKNTKASCYRYSIQLLTSIARAIRCTSNTAQKRGQNKRDEDDKVRSMRS